MATKYAVNAGGSWGTDATWSTVSAKDASRVPDTTKPVAGDTVYIDDYSGDISIDTVPVAGAKATGVWTPGGAAIAVGNTITINGKQYQYVSPRGSTEGNLLRQTTTSNSLQVAVWGITKTGSSTYYVAALPNPYVTATKTTTQLTVTALVEGDAGNSITLATNKGSWNNATCTGGSDPILADQCAVLDFTGYTGTFTQNQAFQTSGNVTLSSTMTYTNTTSTWTFTGGTIIPDAGITFYKVAMSNAVTISTEDMVISNSFLLNVGATVSGGKIVLSGATWSGTGYVSANVDINGDGAINGTIYGGMTLRYVSGSPSITIGTQSGATATLDMGGYSFTSLTIGNASTITLSGDIYATNATYGGVTFVGAYSQTISNQLILSGGNTYTFTGDVTCAILKITNNSGIYGAQNFYINSLWQSGGPLIGDCMINFTGAGYWQCDQLTYYTGCNVTIDCGANQLQIANGGAGWIACFQGATLKYVSGTLYSAGGALYIRGVSTIESGGCTWPSIVFDSATVTTLNDALTATLIYYNSATSFSFSGAFDVTTPTLRVYSTTIDLGGSNIYAGRLYNDQSAGTANFNSSSGKKVYIGASGISMSAGSHIAGTATVCLLTGNMTLSGPGDIANNLELATGAGNVGFGTLGYKTGAITYTSGTQTGAIYIVGSCTLPTANLGCAINVGAISTVTLSGNIGVTGNLSLTAATTFSGAYNITCTGLALSSTGTHTLSGDIDCNGTLTVSAAASIVNGFTIYVGGSITLTAVPISGTTNIVWDNTGTWTGSNTAAIMSNNLEIKSVAATVTIGTNAYYRTGILKYTSGTVASTGALNLYGACTLSTSGCTLPNTNFNTAGTYTMTEAFNCRALTLSATLTFSGAFDITCTSLISPASTLVHTLSGNIDCNGAYSSTGFITFNNYKLYISGNLGLTGGSLAGSTNIVLDGTGSWYGTSISSTVSNNLEIASGGSTRQISDAYYKTGILKWTSGTVSSGGTLSFYGACTLSTAGTTLGPCTFVTTGTYTMTEAFKCSTLTLTGATTFAGNYLLTCTTLTSAVTAQTHTFSGPVTVNGNVTIGAGAIFAQGTGQWSVSGNWTNNKGALGRTGNNTITFTGSPLLTGSTSFYNVYFNRGITVTLAVGTTQTITGNLSMNRVTLKAATAAKASVAKALNTSVYACSFKDLSVTGGKFTAYGSNDLGNNTGITWAGMPQNSQKQPAFVGSDF